MNGQLDDVLVVLTEQSSQLKEQERIIADERASYSEELEAARWMKDCFHRLAKAKIAEEADRVALAAVQGDSGATSYDPMTSLRYLLCAEQGSSGGSDSPALIITKEALEAMNFTDESERSPSEAPTLPEPPLVRSEGPALTPSAPLTASSQIPGPRRSIPSPEIPLLQNIAQSPRLMPRAAASVTSTPRGPRLSVANSTRSSRANLASPRPSYIPSYDGAAVQGGGAPATTGTNGSAGTLSPSPSGRISAPLQARPPPIAGFDRSAVSPCR